MVACEFSIGVSGDFGNVNVEHVIVVNNEDKCS